MPSAKFDFTLEPRQLRARVRALETLVIALYAHLDLRPPELGTLMRQLGDRRADPSALRESAQAVAAAVLRRRRRGGDGRRETKGRSHRAA